jgi:hypothetical protein
VENRHRRIGGGNYGSIQKLPITRKDEHAKEREREEGGARVPLFFHVHHRI